MSQSRNLSRRLSRRFAKEAAKPPRKIPTREIIGTPTPRQAPGNLVLGVKPSDLWRTVAASLAEMLAYSVFRRRNREP